MVRGVGVDILNTARLNENSLRPGDPFLEATYSPDEIAEAVARPDPHAYFAGRFCAKEAVFKSLGIDGQRILLREIEILSDETGRPFVRLSGEIARAAARRGIEEVLVSLSYDGDRAQAFALAQGSGAPGGKETI